MHRILTAAFVVVFIVAVPMAASAADLVLRPPTDRPVLDPFRPPAGPYAPGNRGIEYATEAGDSIRAAADGRVAFAGPVGGNLFVTVDHGGDLRTTYGFVGRILVRRGDQVTVGRRLASAAGPFHFTLRRGDTYLDPSRWFGRLERRAWLIGTDAPDGAAPPGRWSAAWAVSR